MKSTNSIYEIAFQANNGQVQKMADFKGKKMLIVNTASNCGYTAQYAELQDLYDRYRDKLVVIAFPANDFGEQEKGSDDEIATFCKVNYGISFPLAKKSQVVKGQKQHPVFQWLTNPELNGWCSQQPEWNFSKYLVDEQGELTHYFPTNLSPLDEAITRHLD